MLNLIKKSSLAGLLIGLASCIYVNILNTNPGIIGKILGSFLFSIGLISIILLQSYLYTGKVGYIENKKDFVEILLILVINIIIAYTTGFIYNIVYGEQAIMLSKINKTWYRMLLDSIFTGMLIYLAVELYKKSLNILSIIIPVMAFILSGFEHSIADVVYFGMGSFNLIAILYILIAIIGNAVGSLIVRFLQKGVKDVLWKNK